MLKRKGLPIETIIVSEIEVWSKNGLLLIGSGLIYFNRHGVMQPDLVNLVGEPLPPGWCSIKPVGEPKLAVRAKSVQ